MAIDYREGRGQALDGLVTVTAGRDGRITGIQLDPRLRRLHIDEMAAAVMAAANAALDAAEPDPHADEMARFTGALTEALNRLGRP
ncbi:YbaB/EbfC family nucleoid-associated protein [Catenuloplanes atrovinosus]|uniref:DNA-binding protein YbaB n=1 Tax=Catenuloplanes atrovinosus TaxID=137266 RepID=A0AAE3YM65_9ACTN|nr:YbaB/EbfC family nucleoid-associated protein [Catenuloplanes atrovinosus]MDR7276080.1 DNA-binding protein YbaB [Catenuloplanes atrovinosus]